MLGKEEITDYLLNPNTSELFNKADAVREKYVGEKVHIRALTEFSNYCCRTCYYCGLRCENKNIKRYRLSPDEIIKTAEYAIKKLNLKTIVLQSGEDLKFSIKELCKIISTIKQYDVAVTLSIGEKTYNEYKNLKLAGADRYLLRIETTDKKLYESLHPKMSFENRLKCLYDLKELGYETGTGVLVGLPGQTVDSLADDILFFKKLDADMIGIGPFIPHSDTPLGNIMCDLNNNFIMSLKVMALTRIIMQNINIPATTAMETIHPDGHVLALRAGANVIMINVNDIKYKEKYEIYPDKISVSVETDKNYENLIKQLKFINRINSDDKGFRIK